jgi:hypothetical protein
MHWALRRPPIVPPSTRKATPVYGPKYPRQTLSDFLRLALAYIDQTLRVNRRPDDLYHAYNILRLEEQGAAVDHLYVMLEGQVAILSSGLLSADEALALLKSMRHSDLYRADQHTYMLYPNRELPGFLEKNVVPAERLAVRHWSKR